MNRLIGQVFYKRFGVNTTHKILAPVLVPNALFSLPLKSVYHHITYDGIALGPAADDFVFSGVTKPIFIDNITTLTEFKGTPRRVQLNENALITELRTKNRRVRIMRDLDTVAKDPQTLIVYNYCLLGKLYRYTRSIYTDYYKWHNQFATVVAQMVKTAGQTDNQQYLLAGVPLVLPSISQLNQSAHGISQNLLKIFKSPSSYLLLELWKWLSAERETSLLSAIPRKHLHLINFVYQEAGQWTVMNLGFLDAIREDATLTPEELEHPQSDPLIAKTIRLTPDQVQKRLLHFMMKVMEARTMTANLTPAQQAELVNSGKLEVEPSGDDKVFGDEHPDKHLGENTVIVDATSPVKVDVNSVNVDALDDFKALTTSDVEQEDKDLDHELSKLNSIAEIHANKEESSTLDIADITQAKDLDPGASFKALLDRHADESSISAAEYKRYEKLSQTYKTIPAPDKSGTLDGYIKVNPADLKVSAQVPVFKDSDSVLDKTMLRSSLQSFDSVYREKALGKHTAGMVMALQKAGIAVTDYTVETNESILGDSETHTVRIAPIEGAPSTLVFKVPTVKEDGSWVSGSTTYRLRKQFSDLPLRKIGPDEVALTSYYGKTFVTRGRRKIHNLNEYLHNQVMSIALTSEEGSESPITNVKVANVFDPTLTLPRVCTALAHSFKELTVKGVRYVFDRQEVLKTTPENVLALEKTNKDFIVVAHTTKQAYLLDNFGCLFTAQLSQPNEEPVQVGPLIEALGISLSGVPIEYAEVRIFGEDIPVGFYLAYHLGLTALMSLLKAVPRRVPVGTRVKIDHETEFSITFNDETLVFSRDNTLACLVLGGLNNYWKALKLFSVYSFDNKAVYFNILEGSNLGARYLREMDLIDKMFIDPITLMVLQRMHEPETFRGLLIRACQMLETDQHEHELDLKCMRIKGNELIAGAVYTEMIQSLRQHNSQMGKSNKKVEMHPYAVWKRIVEDPVKMQVSEINPIQSLKEVEAVTFSGTQGRNSRSMTRDTRIFHPSHQGVISESTVDSSDVAINVFLSPNAQFTDALGFVGPYDYAKDGMTSTVSTSAMSAAGSDTDD